MLMSDTANGRIPAIVDKTSGKSKRVFEGASIQLYLCEKYDKEHSISFSYDSDEYWEMVEWLVWMVYSRSCRRIKLTADMTAAIWNRPNARSRSAISLAFHAYHGLISSFSKPLLQICS
jgi:glutathione S-transferase